MNKTNLYINRHVKSVARKHKVAPSRLGSYMYGIVSVESSHKPDAKNKNSTARGLTQIVIGTQRFIEEKIAKEEFAPAMYSHKQYPSAPIGQDKMFDGDYAVKLGMHYLSWQYNKYKDWRKAIIAYHLGSYKETPEGRVYYDKVIGYTPNLIFNNPVWY